MIMIFKYYILNLKSGRLSEKHLSLLIKHKTHISEAFNDLKQQM